MNSDARRSGQSDAGERHIVADLVDIATAQWQPSTARSTYLVNHLLVCQECASDLDATLSTLRSAHIPSTGHWLAARQLLQLLQRVIAEQRARLLLPVYVDTLLTEDEAAAASECPELAAHLLTCASCRREVADLTGVVGAQRASESRQDSPDAFETPSAKDCFASTQTWRPDERVSVEGEQRQNQASPAILHREGVWSDDLSEIPLLTREPFETEWQYSTHDEGPGLGWPSWEIIWDYTLSLMRRHNRSGQVADADIEYVTGEVVLRVYHMLQRDPQIPERVAWRHYIHLIYVSTVRDHYRMVRREARREERITSLDWLDEQPASARALAESVRAYASTLDSEPEELDRTAEVFAKLVGRSAEDEAVGRELLAEVGAKLREYIGTTRNPSLTGQIVSAFLAGVPTEEVARRLGTKYSVVQNALHRLRAALSESFPQVGESGVNPGSGKTRRARRPKARDSSDASGDVR